MEEGQDVCLEVETSRVGAAGTVRWVRGGEPLPCDSRLSVTQNGHVYRLFVHGAVLADQGTYGCESHHDRTLARLSVRRECPSSPNELPALWHSLSWLAQGPLDPHQSTCHY